MPEPLEVVLMGTGTSHGIPMLGCDCEVCRSSNPKNKRTRCSVLIRNRHGQMVIDTPPDLRTQLLRENIPYVHAALFTHAHADHIFGLDDLRLSGHYLDTEIPLHCEPVVEENLARSFAYAFDSSTTPTHKGARPRFRFARIQPGKPFEVLGETITPLRLMHGPLPILGFRIRDFAYCTDLSEIPEETWPLLEGLETLVLGVLRYEYHPTHLNVEQALEVIERIKPQRTYFTHISHALEHVAIGHGLPEGVEPGYDGLRFTM